MANSSKALPVVNPAVIFRSLTEGAVLFSTENEVYFGLNSVGARVWELLASGKHDFDGLCRAVAAEYPEVSADVVRQDIEELLGNLEANRLVSARRSGGASVTGGGNGPASQSGGAQLR